MQIAILLYPGFTGLDAVGPFEVLYRLPDTKITFVAAEAGPCAADAPGLSIVAEPMDTLPSPDVVLVPGGSNTQQYLTDRQLLDWIAAAHAKARWTTSVCTGSLLLGAAGVLDGRRATSHWYELDSLRCFGAEPVSERIVEDGDVITAAGVSAGIDMALRLMERIAGTDYVQAVQLVLEYDPQPPYPCGSTRVASPVLVESTRATMRSVYGPSWFDRAHTACARDW